MDQKIENLSSEDFFKLLEENQKNKDTVLIDCRTLPEFNAGKIKGAVILDFYAPDFHNKLSTLNKDKKYFIYCRTGSRSKIMLDMMQRSGFKEVYNLAYGIVDWAQCGYPID